jgi:hypothetical protein
MGIHNHMRKITNQMLKLVLCPVSEDRKKDHHQVLSMTQLHLQSLQYKSHATRHHTINMDMSDKVTFQVQVTLVLFNVSHSAFKF